MERTSLVKALDRIDQLSDELTIFAKKPWSYTSKAVIAPLNPGGRKPRAIVTAPTATMDHADRITAWG